MRLNCNISLNKLSTLLSASKGFHRHILDDLLDISKFPVHSALHFIQPFSWPLHALCSSPFSLSLGSLYSSVYTLFSWSLTGAIDPMKCPLGYKEYNGSPRATFEDTCEPCLPGSYGADPNRAVCNPCRAGVVCLAAATTDNPVSNGSSLASALGPNATNSYLCPPGESDFNLCIGGWQEQL